MLDNIESLNLCKKTRKINDTLRDSAKTNPDFLYYYCITFHTKAYSTRKYVDDLEFRYCCEKKYCMICVYEREDARKDHKNYTKDYFH